jgi:hypothetical protein
MKKALKMAKEASDRSPAPFDEFYKHAKPRLSGREKLSVCLFPAKP